MAVIVSVISGIYELITTELVLTPALNYCNNRLQEVFTCWHCTTAPNNSGRMLLPTLLLVLTRLAMATNSQTFTTSLTNLGLPSHTYFDASVGVQVKGSPVGALLCEEGNHCLNPWWISTMNSDDMVGNSTADNMTSPTSTTSQVTCSQRLVFVSLLK